MTKRQAVIVLEFNNSKPELRKYGVRYRERGFWPWSWTPWAKARESNFLTILGNIPMQGSWLIKP